MLIRENLSLILAEAMQTIGIRAFVGKLSMDISSRPTYKEPSAESSLRSAEEFINSCRDLVSSYEPHRRLVEPVITPRFVPTCSEDLLQGLGKLAHDKGVRIQSHMAEAHEEVQWVLNERHKHDIDIFDEASSSSFLTDAVLTTFQISSAVCSRRKPFKPTAHSSTQTC